MASNSKRSKISRGSKRSKSSRVVDRISDLPDSILIMILSLLPFETAVQTSTLSKRWRPLCMSLPNLHFDDRRGEKSGVPFRNYVDRLLMNRPVGLIIEKFSLKCGGDYDLHDVNQWISRALDHQVKDLTLAFRSRIGESNTYQLFDDFYTYGNFQVLRLKWRILVNIPSDIKFSRLKVLEFSYVKFSNYESVEKILLNCPVLEDLVIYKCKWLSGSRLYVCGSALKNLMLKCNEYYHSQNYLEIVIHTPALETLKIGSSTCADISIQGTLSSLRTAHISVDINSVFGLLDTIYHVKFLTLSKNTLGYFPGVSDLNLTTFHNLIQLEIRVNYWWSCWNVLRDILASSPNLETLLLPYGVDLTQTGQIYNSGLWRSPRSVPECVSANLKMIEIGIFNATQDEFSLVEYLLQHGKALKNISIYCSCHLSKSKRSKIRKELVNIHRASKTCKIDFN